MKIFSIFRSSKSCSTYCEFLMNPPFHSDLYLSERWLDNLDRSNITFLSVDWMELLSLSSLNDWVNTSNCMNTRATIPFVLLFISLEVILRSNSCNWRFWAPWLPDSPEWCVSPMSTNCLVGVQFSSYMIIFVDANSKVLKTIECFKLEFSWLMI